MKEKDLTVINEIILQNEINYSRIINQIVENNFELINNYYSFLIQKKEYEKKESLSFNLLNYFELNEPKHSFLLAKLIDPNSEHGQGNLFLNILLDKLKINYSINDKWHVSAEKDRIDILIKRSFPETIIIFENKSNYAPDQPNQLYRYWYNQIYLSLKQSSKSYDYYLKNIDKYRIIYLTPNEFKKPDSQSLQKPNWLIDNDLPSTIEPEIWIFKNEIVDYFNECLKNISSENVRLKAFLLFYIDFWKN